MLHKTTDDASLCQIAVDTAWCGHCDTAIHQHCMFSIHWMICNEKQTLILLFLFMSFWLQHTICCSLWMQEFNVSSQLVLIEKYIYSKYVWYNIAICHLLLNDGTRMGRTGVRSYSRVFQTMSGCRRWSDRDRWSCAWLHVDVTRYLLHCSSIIDWLHTGNCPMSTLVVIWDAQFMDVE